MAAGAGSSLCPRGAREHSSHREGPVPTTCSPPKAPPAQRIGAGLCRGFQASRRPRAPELNLLFSPALKGLDFRLAERAVGVPFVTDSPSLSPEAPSGTVQVPEAPVSTLQGGSAGGPVWPRGGPDGTRGDVGPCVPVRSSARDTRARQAGAVGDRRALLPELSERKTFSRAYQRVEICHRRSR